MYSTFKSQVKELIGKKILRVEGVKTGSDNVMLFFESGRLLLTHYQDCCERVYLEDWEGDPGDLVGKELVSATETSNETEDLESCSVDRWTFYSFRTPGGDLWLRWLGTSNGYYSTAVHVEWAPAPSSSEN